MRNDTPEVPRPEFERLQRLIARAAAPCSNGQICELADQLHGLIRRRHNDQTAVVETELAAAGEAGLDGETWLLTPAAAGLGAPERWG